MISLIVAYSGISCVIGWKGKIPWKIKGEQKRFKDLTTDNVVIMGRKTYEEIGKPLPNRKTIVISKTHHYDGDDVVTLSSLKEALSFCEKKYNGLNVFISGGASLYDEAIGIVDTMYITHIHKEVKGDTFFPYFNFSDFDIKIDENYESNDEYTHYIYTRKGEM